MLDFINQIPKMLLGDELREALTFLPEYNESISNANATIRLQKLSDIYQIYIPTSMSIEIYSKFYLAMIRNLKNKHDSADAKSNYVGVNNGDNFSIIGASGLGKSSAIEKAIALSGANKVLNFETPNYNTKIIGAIQVESPHDSSVKGILLSVLQQIDINIGSNYYERAISARASVDVLIQSVAKNATNHTSVIVIDEVQNILSNIVNGKKLIMALTQLINSTKGVSIVMLGTPEAKHLFESDIKLARRSIGLTYDKIPYGPFFIDFCRILYRYQYVKNIVDLDDGTIRLLYQYCDGNFSILKALFYDAQELAILNQSETLDSAALRTAYNQRMDMLHVHMILSSKKQTSVIKNNTELPGSIFSDNTSIETKNINEIIKYAKNHNQNVTDNLKSAGLLMEVAI
ncbi:MAG: AAA family ATPase [Mobilitalea sp.]